MRISLLQESNNELLAHVEELLFECPLEYRAQFQKFAAYEVLSFTTGVSMLQEESNTHGYCESFCDSDIVKWKAETVQKLLQVFEAITVRHQKFSRRAVLN